MMGGATLIGGAIVIGMALIYDADGTVKLVTLAITVRGVTWLIKKITSQISLDASQIIDFAGWSIAGVSIVRIIGNAIGSVNAINAYIGKIGAEFAKISEVVDKITFWN